MKQGELLDLAARYPDLFERALEMEDNAQENLTTVKGLGRRFSWRDFAEEQGLLDNRKVRRGLVLPVLHEEDDDGEGVPCECYDGCAFEVAP